MKRKYLDEKNVDWQYVTPDDERYPYQMKERDELGFPSYETWSLDIHMVYCLYERVRAYLDYNICNLTFHTFEFEDREWTQQELIDELLKECEKMFEINDILKDEYSQAMRRIWTIWREISPAMWW